MVYFFVFAVGEIKATPSIKKPAHCMAMLPRNQPMPITPTVMVSVTTSDTILCQSFSLTTMILTCLLMVLPFWIHGVYCRSTHPIQRRRGGDHPLSGGVRKRMERLWPLICPGCPLEGTH